MKKINRDAGKSILVLSVICLVIAVAMAAINLVTAPKIEEANRKAEQEALQTVLPTAESFEAVEGVYGASVTALYRDSAGSGYVALLSAKGYNSSDPMTVAVGFDTNGTVLRCHVVSCTGETSGIGTKVTEESFLSSFVGADERLDGVDAISGATISSSAFIEAVREGAEAVQMAVKEGTT